MAVLFLYLLLSALSARQPVLSQEVRVPPGALGGSEAAMVFTQPFEVSHRGNVQVELRSGSLRNSWLGVQGDLVNDETNEVTSFYTEVSSYSGSDSEGSWSEGSSVDTEYLSAISPGKYTLRLVPYFDGTAGQSFHVQLVSDVPRFFWVVLAFLALGALPLLQGIRAGSFETRRWQESNIAGSSDD
jgi:hypothetical protein